MPYGLEGAGNLAGMVSDPFGQFLPGYQPTGQMASGLADTLGLPQPQGALEQGVGNASRALVGTGLSAGAGLAAGAPQLAAQPLMQGVSTVTGAGAQDIAREAGGGQMAQILAGLAGGILPGTGAGAQGALRGAIRGGEEGRQGVQQAIGNFAAAGTAPTVGQVAPRMQWLETLMSRTPGATGVMSRKAASQAEEIGAGVNRMADDLARNADPTTAGQAILEGVSGPGGFVSRFKEQAGKLYDEVDQYMPGQTAMPMKSTEGLLARLSTPTKGAEATSALLSNPKLAGIREALTTDLGPNGTIPYEAAKALRTRVGSMLGDFSLTSDVPRGELKQLYGALSDDLRAATSKNPKAFAANNRAENFYRENLAKIENLERVVGKAGGPEKIYNAAMQGTREGSTTIREVMSALKGNEAKEVSSAVLRRMGRANNSAQNDVADKFSTGTFLTNWAAMDKGAKNVLFSRYGDDFAANMDKIAKVTSNLRDGADYLRNPSGTAGALAQQTTAATAVVSALTGNVGVTAGIAAGAGAANLTARLMTNPKFVSWLARQTNRPVGVLPAQIGVLAQSKDPDLQEAAQLLGSM